MPCRAGKVSRMEPARALRRWLLVIVSTALPPALTATDLPDSFETPETRWKLADYDVVPRVSVRRSYDRAHRGNASEHLRVEAGGGSYVHFRYPVKPMPLHDDLRPSMWVQADRAGVQIQAVVVLPRSVHPRTGEPLRTVIRGSSTDGTGGWQELAIQRPRRLLSQKLPHLFQQFGRRVDAREAYLDHLVINAYGGPGTTNVWIDDLDVQGYVPAATFGIASERRGAPRAVSPERDPDPLSSVSSVRLETGVLIVDDRPFLPRSIDYNGESFEWLKGLGFNTIRLSLPPSVQQLRDARKWDLWLLAPPAADRRDRGELWGDRVLAWDLGSALTHRDSDALRRLKEGVRQRDSLRRPTICSPRSGYWDLSQYTDILLFEQNVIGTTFELEKLGESLRWRRRLARPGKPSWVCLQTQTPRQLNEQFVLLGAGNGTSFGLDSAQVRMMAYQALTAGIRGFCFKSRSRLDSTDPATRLRALTLKGLNHELKLLRPWVTMGRFVETRSTRSEGSVVLVLQARRSRLAIILAQGVGQQHVLAPFAAGPVSFDLFGIPATDRLYAISVTGPRELRRHHGPRITHEDPDRVSLIALTEDPAVRNHIAQYASQNGREMVELRTELLRGALEQTRNVDQSIAALGYGEARLSQSLATADLQLQRATQMWLAGDLAAADRLVRGGEQMLDQVRQTHWEQAVRTLPSAATSPYCLLFSSLPSHWQWFIQVRSARWGPNALAAGDFESLPRLLSGGWRQQREAVTGVDAAVELSVSNPQREGAALHLRVWPENTAAPPEAIETAPVMIHSAPVPLRASQLIRIHGWVNIPAPVRGTHDGLAIFDSVGGWNLAERVKQTTGWREFLLYRAADGDHPLVVTFALTGMGEAWIDDVSISLWDRSASHVSPPRPVSGPAPPLGRPGPY